MYRNALVSIPRGLTTALAVLLLAGCGLAETSATAVAEAEAAAEQAKQGKALEEKVQRDIAASQKATAEAYDRAESEASR